eukprot:TRINITY_DN24135_c0_g1_i1.p1 TRINITY_DN24135_c0_g1~~TRINITY_DN24135_c0_g1_i1.p1  ORF type:complete len:646 (-),score=153.02 TRINITY_DN24135_c0_g1_i1:125-2062(-)
MLALGISQELCEEEAPCIFAELVSVHVKPSGRDDFTAQLTVRLRPDNPAHPRSLLLELTDENDLLFFHSLALSEGDFHSLRSEQRLLVDFQSFPAQLADLLRRCCNADASQSAATAAGGPSRMIACLDCSATGESLFSIIESNHFRELTHIALRLRQGSDEVVKQHLAKKLKASRTEASSLSERLASSEEALTHSRKQNDELTARARVVSEERLRLEQSMEATHQRELAELRQEHNRAFADLQRTSTEERAKLEKEHCQALQDAVSKAKAAESANEELQAQRMSLTSSGDSCREQLRVAESRLQEATKETFQLREEVKQLESLKFQNERELAELKVQVASTKEQLVVRGQHAASQAAQIEEAVAQRRILEETLAACRKQAQSLEEKFALSAQEIAKGNRIIQSLHNGSKETKAKLRLKSAELAQHAKSMIEFGKADEMSKHVLGAKEDELSRAKEREERLQQDVEEIKKKLAEAHDVIKSNQDVIEYLNRQLTERDLKSLPRGTSAIQTQNLDAAVGFRGGGSSALAELLGKAEGFARSPAKKGHSFGGMTSSGSMGSIGLGTVGVASLALGSTVTSGGLDGDLGIASAVALPSSERRPDIFSSPGAFAGLAGMQSTIDSPLKGPVAYRRPGSSGFDSQPTVAIA